MTDAGWAAAGAAGGGAITGLFAWLTQRVRGASTIEVAVIAEWQKLNAALSERVSALELQIAEVRREHAREIDQMRKERREEREKHRAEMQVQRELNEGLQRQIAQNSQSTAHLIRPSDKPKDRP